MNALVLLVLSTFVQPSVELDYNPPAVVAYVAADTGISRCYSMDQHFHNSDGLCHLDSTDEVAPERKTVVLKRRHHVL